MFFKKFPHISTLELQKLLMSNPNIELIDVREPFEFNYTIISFSPFFLFFLKL